MRAGRGEGSAVGRGPRELEAPPPHWGFQSAVRSCRVACRLKMNGSGGRAGTRPRVLIYVLEARWGRGPSRVALACGGCVPMDGMGMGMGMGGDGHEMNEHGWASEFLKTRVLGRMEGGERGGRGGEGEKRGQRSVLLGCGSPRGKGAQVTSCRSPSWVLVQPRKQELAGALAGVRWQPWAICSCADPSMLATVCGAPSPLGRH